MFLNLYVWKCIQHKGWYYSLFLRVGLTQKISCIAILLWCESNFKNNTNLCDSITQKMLLDSLFVALVNYLEYYYAIIICLFTKIFPARGSKASTLLNGENSYLIRWINSFSLLTGVFRWNTIWHITAGASFLKHFDATAGVLYGLSQAFGKKLGRGGY